MYRFIRFFYTGGHVMKFLFCYYKILHSTLCKSSTVCGCFAANSLKKKQKKQSLVSVLTWLYSSHIMKFIHRCPACRGLCNTSLLQYATCPCQTGPPQQLMSLKTLRWVVALITNHGCLPPAAASAAAVPVIDDILQDSPRPGSTHSKCLFPL